MPAYRDTNKSELRKKKKDELKNKEKIDFLTIQNTILIQLTLVNNAKRQKMKQMIHIRTKHFALYITPNISQVKNKNILLNKIILAKQRLT